MTSYLRTARNLFLSSILLTTCLASPALALDATDFTTKLTAAMDQTGSKFKFDAVETKDDSVTLKKVHFINQGAHDISIGDVEFDGVEEAKDGSYYVNLVHFDNVDTSLGETHFLVDDINIKGLMIPAKPNYDTLAGFLQIANFSTGQIKVENKGADVFSMSGITSLNTYSDDGLSQDSNLTGSNIKINLDQIENQDAQTALSDLSYKSLTGTLKMKVSWDNRGGVLDLSEYSLDLDQVGRLNMTLKVSGYTLDFIKEVRKLQNKLIKINDPEQRLKASNAAMLALIQNLNFMSASVDFKDASVTNKIIDAVAKQKNLSQEKMKEATKVIIPTLLAGMGLPMLQKEVNTAVSTFIDNPDNFTISAKPQQPVAFSVLMNSSTNNAQALADLLNLHVTANQ